MEYPDSLFLISKVIIPLQDRDTGYRNYAVHVVFAVFVLRNLG